MSTSPTILHASLLTTSKADMLPLVMKPAACDKNMIFILKPVDQTFVATYSTSNPTNIASSVEI